MGESTAESAWISAAEFHRAPGVADWRVTGSGPQAVFTATSLAHSARFVDPIVDAAERFGVRPDIDVRPEGVVVRVAFGDEGIPAAAAGFAAAVSEAAAGLSLTAGLLGEAGQLFLRSACTPALAAREKKRQLQPSAGRLRGCRWRSNWQRVGCA